MAVVTSSFSAFNAINNNNQDMGCRRRRGGGGGGGYPHGYGWIAVSSSFNPDSNVSVSEHNLTNTPVNLFLASSDRHLRCACNLRIRTFCDLPYTFRAEDHLRYLSAIEFEALKEKMEGKREAFGKVHCLLAALPLSSIDPAHEQLLTLCKINADAETSEDQVVVGSLDINQTAVLPNELVGSRPKGDAAKQHRGYLSNVCVAKELQRRRIGSSLITYAKGVAASLGMTDLYTHVAVGNGSAEKLYKKCGFIEESSERSSEARLMGRPPRRLLWHDLTQAY